MRRARVGIRRADRSRSEPGERMPATHPVRVDGEQIFVSVAEDQVNASGDACNAGVGPVLQATPFARSVVSVIEEENPPRARPG